MSTAPFQALMLKRFTIAVVLLTGGQIHAEIPKNPTKEQIIASCVADKVTVQERVALQGCKTKLDAAELLQSMYQERYDHYEKLKEYDFYNGCNNQDQLKYLMKGYRTNLDEINALIDTLKNPPSKKKKK